MKRKLAEGKIYRLGNITPPVKTAFKTWPHALFLLLCWPFNNSNLGQHLFVKTHGRNEGSNKTQMEDHRFQSFHDLPVASNNHPDGNSQAFLTAHPTRLTPSQG